MISALRARCRLSVVRHRQECLCHMATDNRQPTTPKAVRDAAILGSVVRYRYVLILAIFVAGVAHGADVAISTPSTAPTAAQPRDAVVVALGDGFLAIWTEGPACESQEIRAIRLDRDGHPRDLQSFVVSPANNLGYRIIATASEGDEAYVEWAGAF